MRRKNKYTNYFILTFFTLLLCLCASCNSNSREQESKNKIVLIKEKHSNGELKRTGALIDSLKQGYWVQFDEAGNLQSECIYLNDTLHGEFNLFYPSGKFKIKGFMNKNNWHGKRTLFYINGNIINTGLYNYGKQDSIWEYYDETGNLDKKILYGNDSVLKIIEDNNLYPIFP